MCDRPAPVSALCPRVEISAVAVVVLALACLNKNNNNNNNQKEDEHSGVYVSWRLTTSLSVLKLNYRRQHKLSVDVSDVFSHELSRRGLQ